ncbi:uncharacterized protein LOC127705606 [Mytilus californianus]|uniref:uncharacterized protein LOC127705606 n=1 Tax=Mytilus californianus TaxID=6549 RepID=UPI002247065D|nr:uncharacterized protein LOC127705606 [Mytilus californianus]
MADVLDTDSSEDVIPSKQTDSLVGYVIQHALMDSDEDVPETGDEFWKPVSGICYKEVGDISVCATEVTYGNLNLNRHNVSNVSCSSSQKISDNEDSSNVDKSSLRKAVSDESIILKRHEIMKKEMPEELFPNFQSEKSSPEIKRDLDRRRALDESAEFESSSSSEEEIEPEEDKFDFFREFELKVDVLEYCDMAVEESFEMLKLHVLDLVDMPTEKEIDEEQVTNGNAKHLKSDETKVENPENVQDAQPCKSYEKDPTPEIENNRIAEVCDKDIKFTNLTAEKEPQKMQEKALMVTEILQVLHDRFEKFIGEVSEIVHLGALSVRHAQRVDQWGAEVQKTYQKIYADHQKMKAYLEERETDWVETREQYQSEIVRQGQQITNILQRLHIYNDIPDTPRRHNDKHKTADVVNSVLMKRRCQEEQAMSLDFARQAKISELKLLIIQQQGYIQRLQLKNAELNSIIRDVLYAKPYPEEASETDNGKAEEVERLQNVADVLSCDMASYLPNKSVDSDIVSRQVFNIGSTKACYGQKRVPPNVYPVFDPHKLSYICLDALSTQKNVNSGGYEAGDKSNDQCDDEENDKKENVTNLTGESELQNDKNIVNHNVFYDCSTANVGQVADLENAIPSPTFVSA